MQATIDRPFVSTQPSSVPLGRWGVRGMALTYLTLLLIIPLAVIFQDGLANGVVGLWRSVTQPVARSAL